MSTYVPAALRRAVAQRADNLCEYCLIHEHDTFFGCQIEHVIAEKHGGLTSLENLAYACMFCNRFKGSDVGGISTSTTQLVRLFNPRDDIWRDHFSLDFTQMTVNGLTEIGETTVRLLRVNDPDRVLERLTLTAVGRYPTAEALHRIAPAQHPG